MQQSGDRSATENVGFLPEKRGEGRRTAKNGAIVGPRPRLNRQQRQAAKVEAVSLPEDGKRLVAYLVDPANLGKSPADQAAAVGIDLQRLAEIKRHPAYQRTLTKVASRQLAEGVPAVIASWLRSATMDGVNGHRDRRLFLEAVGMLPSKSGPSTVLQTLVLGGAAGDTGQLADRLAEALRRSGEEVERMASMAAEDPPIIDADPLDVVSEDEEDAV